MLERNTRKGDDLARNEAVALRYYADLSEAQTAEVMGVSVGTVKSQTSRGLEQLSRRMEATR